MSLMRKRRLERLVRRQPRGPVYRDCSDWAVPFLLAVLEGRPHSALPRPDVQQRTDEQEQARHRVFMMLDTIHDRLGGAKESAKAEADRQRR
jgi:hypothetical protein